MKKFILILIIVLSGCHPLFCSWEIGYTQLKTRPDNSEIVGIYKLSDDSRDFLEARNYKKDNYKLTLLSNGEFEFKNAPDMIFDTWGESNKKLLNRNGIWNVSCAESYDCLIELQGVCVVPLTIKDNRLSIPITIGDGDFCEGIVYEKIAE